MLKKSKSQLLLLSTLPAIIITLGLIIYMNYARLQDFNHYLQQRGENSSSQVAALSRIALQRGSTDILQILASNTLEENGVRSVNIYAANGNLLAHAGPKTYEETSLTALLPQVTELKTLHFDNSMLFISAMNSGIYTSDWDRNTAQHSSPENLGWVSIEYNKDRFTLNRYNSLLSQNSVFIFFLVFAALCGFYIQRRFNRDLNQIRNTLKQLSDGTSVANVTHCQNLELQDIAMGIYKLDQAYQSEFNELKHSMELTTSDLKETIETIEIQNIELGLAQKQALQASQVKSEFLANTSHEIRTPLNGIIGFAKILKRTALNVQQQEYLETILLSSDGLLTIINDILDFSKIEAGKLELEPAPCHLRQIFEEVVSLFAPLAYEKKLEINLLFYQDTPCHLHLDAARLKQVLSNIISNAIKFTHQGEIVIRVALEAEDCAENRVAIKVTVSDTGIGMTTLQQKGLFQAFTQSNASISREYGGTGLGLAISKKLIEKFNGDISVDSALEKGSTFSFNFWAEKQSQTQALEAAAFTGKAIALISHNNHTGMAIENLLHQWGVKTFLLGTDKNLEQALQDVMTHYHIDSVIYAPNHLNNNSNHLNDYQLLANKFQLKLLALTATPGFYHEDSNDEKLTIGYQPITETSLYRSLSCLFSRVTINENLQQDTVEQHFAELEILAVDDNPANLKLLSILLKDLGASVTTATDGEQAIHATQKQHFDLIFMDLQMPIINGLEACKHIRKHLQTPIIALTAHALADEKQQLLDIGVNDYLSKPINEDILIETVNKLCHSTAVKTVPETPKAITSIEAVNVKNCLSLANYKVDLAIDMFTMLVSELKNDIQLIEECYEQEDAEKLLEQVHKLNGACSYTGVIKLKQACMALETVLKAHRTALPKHDHEIAVLMAELIKEASAVLAWCESYDIADQLKLEK